MQFTDARKYKKQIRHLYRSAFPANERAPLGLLFHKTDNGKDSFYAVTDEDRFIGLTYTIESDKMLYVFFLAVTNENRGKGYGTKILDIIKKKYCDKTVCLLIEDTTITSADNFKERIKRLAFYERNGFTKLGIKIDELGVKYELLGTEENITQADFLSLMKDWLSGFLFKIIYKNTKAK